ncbi:hypothetical protein ALC62_08710 [Cyphomyrmex costatus]|uniref:RNase H type-1 domain-containing protein n=1 Tax=Cyphomyrmex costatus TaxID=456900 RepID=A0A151IGJ4_9HYME|nr:hypothetical protein ALC62_08710 [Cyphomyrmex costatus]
MFKLSSYTSVFSAEAYAIYTAITVSIDLRIPKITVVTDSKSVFESIKGSHNYTNNYLIPLIKSALEEAETKGTEIRIRMKITREVIVMINRLRSNHYNLNYSLYRKNLIDNSSCPCSSPHQDIIHLIYECSYTYNDARFLRYTVDCASRAEDKMIKFSQAIANPSPCLCRLIQNFSKFCGRQF